MSRTTFDFTEPCQTIMASNGTVIDITTDGESSSVVFACEKGYTLKGDSVSVCQDNLQWDSVPPDCGKTPYYYTSYLSIALLPDMVQIKTYHQGKAELIPGFIFTILYSYLVTVSPRGMLCPGLL